MRLGKSPLAVLLLVVVGFAAKVPQAAGATIDLDDGARIVSQVQDIVGLEFILNIPTGGPIYSRWGHALLRLVNPKIPASDNLVISFVADVPSNHINYYDGIVGGYKVAAEIETLGELALQRNEEQNASLERFIIATKSADLRSFLSKLTEWIRNPAEMGDYTFLANNCAGALSRLFATAGLMPRSVLMPRTIPRLLESSGVSPFPPLLMRNYGYYWNEIAQATRISPKIIQKTQSLSDRQVDAVLSKVGPLGLAILLYKDFSLDEETKSRVRVSLAPHMDEVSFDDLDQIHDAPVVLYKAPETSADFSAINQARLDFFGEAGLRSDLDFLEATSRRSRLTEYERMESSRIESDPSFRSITLQGDLSGVTSGAKLSLSVHGNELELADLSDFGPDGGTAIYTLGGAFAVDGSGARIGDLICPSDDCRAISSDSGVRIVGFKK